MDRTVSTIKYYWGKDLSGELQGAGGVGGLLYLTIDGVIYIPCYDNNGNVTKYINANGGIVASYIYNAFGNTISQSGPLADFFRHRFSTKYFDTETNLYYYGYRFYHPILMRWLNRDPIEENGGVNLYGFCGNNVIVKFDKDSRAYFAVRGLGPIPKSLKWSDFMSGLRSAMCPFASFSQQERDAIDKAADLNNIEILHEQLFFEDGKMPRTIGWSKSGYLNDESTDGYITTTSGYDDCIMREAVEDGRKTFITRGAKSSGLSRTTATGT